MKVAVALLLVAMVASIDAFYNNFGFGVGLGIPYGVGYGGLAGLGGFPGFFGKGYYGLGGIGAGYLGFGKGLLGGYGPFFG